MAGNIPLVGLHDFISVIICGHKAAIKKSPVKKVVQAFFPGMFEGAKESQEKITHEK